MKTILLTFALIAITTTNAWAQSFGASQITLRAPGATNSVLLTPGTLTGPRTFTFPDGDGQLLVTSGAGTTSPAWLLGGNTLTGPGPGPTGNQLGSLTAHDVTLIAGTTASPGNERLTLNNGTNSVTTGRGTELRLLNPLGTFYTALVAAAHAVDITYTMPLANGTVGQVLRIASSPAPTASAATLEWATVSGGGGGSGGSLYKIQLVDQTTASGAVANASGLQYVLTTGVTYNVGGTIRVSTADANNDPQVGFSIPGGGSTINVTLTKGATSVNIVAFSTDYTLATTVTTAEDWVVTGTITTAGAISASGLTIRRTGSSNMTLYAGSVLTLTP